MGPVRRNPLTTLLIPVGVIVGGAIVGTILTIILAKIALALAPVGSLLTLLLELGGCVLLLLSMMKMASEIKSVTRNEAFVWWHMLIPFYNIYWIWILLPQEVT
jgi:hypothetical protein